jgi:hypothetical protein
MATTADFGLQITRSDGRVMFDSRTWGPCVYDWLDTSTLPYTLVNGFDRQFTIFYPAKVTVTFTNMPVDNVVTPNGFSIFPKIVVVTDAAGSVVTITMTDGAVDCKLLVVGA